MFWLLHSATAFAQAAAPAAAPGTGEGPSMLMSVVPFIFIFAVFYFLTIRPQAKKQRDHAKFLGELKRGDEVITASGMLGRIEGLTDQFVTLEIAQGVRVKMLRNQVSVSSRTAIEATKKEN